MAEVRPRGANRTMAVLGPIKMEIANLSGTNDTDTAGVTQTGVSTADTFVSNLQRPLFAIMVGNVENVDGWLTAISGRTVTMTNAGQTTAAAHLLVFGF